MPRPDPFPHATFDRWCGVVSIILEVYAGRTLADLDVPDAWLRVWWRTGIPARVVASALTTRCPPRATLVRFHTDHRPLDVLTTLSKSYQRRAVRA